MDSQTDKPVFLSLIQDETFINLVTEAEGSDEFLRELLNRNPQNRESIKYAFEFIIFLFGNECWGRIATKSLLIAHLASRNYLTFQYIISLCKV